MLSQDHNAAFDKNIRKWKVSESQITIKFH